MRVDGNATAVVSDIDRAVGHQRKLDAAGMAGVTEALAAAGIRVLPSDRAYVESAYLDNPSRIACTLAEDASGRILGFQWLGHAIAGNAYGTPEGWGVIGTHVAPDAPRQGIGRGLFAKTRAAIAAACLPQVEACIGAANAPALAYYGAMGFKDWRAGEGPNGPLSVKIYPGMAQAD